MKELYIQDKRVVLADGTYFPFTQKVTDLDDVTIIGIPATKSIDIPRCVDNDEIFGNIADIHRLVVGDADEKVCISFNQIKKATYKLYNNSEIISEGVIRITAINDANYTIELYDKVLELLDELSGDDETESGYLNSIVSLRYSDNSEFGHYSEMSVVSNLITSELDTPGSEEYLPIANIREYDSTGNVVIAKNTSTSDIQTVEVPTEMTPIQFRCLKSYEFEWASSIKSLLHTINYELGSTIISYDSYCQTLFENVWIKLGKPKKDFKTTTSAKTGSTLVNSNGSNGSAITTNLIKKFGATQMLGSTDNGKFSVEIPLTLTFTPDHLVSNTISISTIDGGSANVYTLASPPSDGTIIGRLYFKLSRVVASTSYGTELASSQESVYAINIVYGSGGNLTINQSGGYITSLVVNTTIRNEFDFYEGCKYDYYYYSHYEFDFTSLLDYDSGNKTLLFYTTTAPYSPFDTFTLNTVIGNYNQTITEDRFGTYDYMNGKSLLPKVSIRDLFVNIAKAFNLGIENNNGVLKFKQKIYTLSSEQLIVSEISDINVNNFDFSQLILSSKNNDSEDYKNYKEFKKREYGDKIINTGYNIKKSTKKIEFPHAAPGVITDYNGYAYQTFMAYANGGYSLNINGVTQGLDDSIVFGYIHKVNERLRISNDTTYECNMSDNEITYLENPTELKYVLSNLELNYNPTSGEFSDSYGDTYSKVVDGYFTFIPFKIGTDGVIDESLEMNKPLYNFAGFTDTTYPSGVNLYDNYHKKVVEEAYNVNTHILSVTMWIDKPIDIYKIYNYKNTYYRIIEITEYDPTEPGLYEIKLMRVNNLANYGL